MFRTLVLKRYFQLGPIGIGPVALEAREYQPCKRTISVQSSYSPNGKRYFLQFPYLIFVKQVSLGIPYFRVAFSLAPIQSIDSPIYFPTLPNVDNNHNACTGSKLGGLTSMVDRFWSMPFVHSLSWPGAGAMMRCFGSFPKWAKLDLDEVCIRIEQNCESKPFADIFIPRVKFNGQLGTNNTAANDAVSTNK